MNNNAINLGSVSSMVAQFFSKNEKGTIPTDGTITIYANNCKVFVNYESSGTAFRQPLKY